MIPQRIRLVNFLSYRECELDMAGLRLAVLSGKNGEGKSALLDAITWATWGKARGARDDQRVRLGAEHVLVEYEFEVSETRYRVVRKRTRNRASALDFFQKVGDGWKAITGPTIAETQAEINRRVRMDFETFENSAFIAQGRADEFTKRTASQRKEVFRKILGLEMYEELAKAATDRRKDVERDSKAIRDQIERAEEQLEELPCIEKEIADVREGVAASDKQRAELEVAVGDLRELAAVHSRLARQLEEQRGREAQLYAELTGARKQQTDAEESLAEAQALLAGETDVRERHTKLLALRAEEEVLAAAMQAVRALEREINEAVTVISRERAGLDAEAQSLQRQAEQRRIEALALPDLRERIARCEVESEAITAVRAEAKREAAESTAHREARAAAEATAQRCKAENKELHGKREELLKAKQDGGTTECPVCRQPLDPDDLDHVLDEYTAQKKELGERFAEATATAERESAAAEAAEKRCETLTKNADDRERQVAKQRQEIDRKLGLAEEAERALPELELRLARVREVIQSEAFASDARERLATAERSLAESGYDGERHALVRSEIATLGDVDTAMQQIAGARERVALLMQKLADLAERIERTAVAADSILEAIAATETELEAAEDVGPRLSECESELAALRNEQGRLQVQLGGLQRQEQMLRELQAATEEAKTQASACIEEAGVFTDLSQAFGRDGVQAMLIAQSLPRLEFIANAMLERMTGGRITVRLRTTKTSKAGVLQDTLDILIQDEAGVRDYEMYSGGEAFRVDFALRIALARLLAERAGAELPTLIIDEGFGSQDADGIDRLVDAITSVSDEFRLILVVTHVEEMRGRFEQRIEVTKDPQKGSIARIA